MRLPKFQWSAQKTKLTVPHNHGRNGRRGPYWAAVGVQELGKSMLVTAPNQCCNGRRGHIRPQLRTNIQQNWVACAACVVVASIFGAYCRHVFFMLCRGHSSAMLEVGDTTPCECCPRFAPSGILLASRVGTQPTFYFHTRRDVRACGKSQVKLEHITRRRYVSHVLVHMWCISSALLQN